MQRILSVDLLHELSCDGLVSDVRVGPGSHVEGCVLQDGDVRAQVADQFCRELALLCDSGGELPRVILNVLRDTMRMGIQSVIYENMP